MLKHKSKFIDDIFIDVKRHKYNNDDYYETK